MSPFPALGSDYRAAIEEAAAALGGEVIDAQLVRTVPAETTVRPPSASRLAPGRAVQGVPDGPPETLEELSQQMREQQAADEIEALRRGLDEDGIPYADYIVTTPDGETYADYLRRLRPLPSLALPETDLLLGRTGSGFPETALMTEGSGPFDYTTFYHGTDARGELGLRLMGIDITRGSLTADFGQGFYMTTSRVDALASAGRPRGTGGRVVEFRVPNYALDTLNTFRFTAADSTWRDFVTYNKIPGNLPPLWLNNGPQIDMFVGPYARVQAGNIVQMTPLRTTPQTSIHTFNAAQLFNRYMVPSR